MNLDLEALYNYLTARNSLPTVEQDRTMPYGVHGSYNETSNKIRLNPKHPDTLEPSLLHEMVHGSLAAIRDHVREYRSFPGGIGKTNEEYQLQEGYKKLMVPSKLPFASDDEAYRKDPEEFLSFGLSGMNYGNKSYPTKPHVDATGAQEMQILLDLANRANQNQPKESRRALSLRQLFGL